MDTPATTTADQFVAGRFLPLGWGVVLHGLILYDCMTGSGHLPLLLLGVVAAVFDLLMLTCMRWANGATASLAQFKRYYFCTHALIAAMGLLCLAYTVNALSPYGYQVLREHLAGYSIYLLVLSAVALLAIPYLTRDNYFVKDVQNYLGGTRPSIGTFGVMMFTLLALALSRWIANQFDLIEFDQLLTFFLMLSPGMPIFGAVGLMCAYPQLFPSGASASRSGSNRT